jgi:thymidine kinase
MQPGYLELILGPMFSGKTSKLIELYKQFTFCNIQVMTINHASDIRYDMNMMSNHDKNMIECYQLQKISNIWSDINKPMYDAYIHSKVILINEGQFFPDLYESVLIMLLDNKKIYIGGLDGDFQRKKFGQILDLIPMCDKVTKLSSICSLCRDGTPGIFSKRLTNETEQTIVGSDNYVPVCRNCFENEIK